jgi:hypothetical protein
MKTTLEMAREADLIDDTFASDWYVYQLKAFEALVRADERNRTWTQEHWTEYERSIATAEREACAKVCDDRAFQFFSESPFFVEMHGLADAIRARGNT